MVVYVLQDGHHQDPHQHTVTTTLQAKAQFFQPNTEPDLTVRHIFIYNSKQMLQCAHA
jgi:hypothetical protein